MAKILAIDDKSDNLISLKAILKDAFPDAVLYTALSGQKGIELAAAENPDVILLDILMPGMDGFDVCRELKLDERLRDIPVIFLTATKGDRDLRIKALEAGGEGFLSKPIDEPELTAQIRAMLKIKAANEQKKTENEHLAGLVAERTRELRESELYFRTLANSGQLLIWTSGTDMMCDYFNVPWLEFTGRTLAQELGEGWTEGVLPSDLQKCVETYVNAFKKREKFSMEYRVRHNSGEYRWIQDDGTPRYDSKGEFLGYIGHCLDITNLKRSEQELRENEAKFRNLFENSTMGKSMTNLDGTLHVNKSFCEIVGYSEEELRTKKWIDISHPDDIPITNEIIKSLLDGTIAVAKFEKRYIHKNGNIIWADVSTYIQRNNDGSPQFFITSIIDNTKKKLAEEELKSRDFLLNKVFDLLPVGLWLADRNGKLTRGNPAGIKIWGAEPTVPIEEYGIFKARRLPSGEEIAPEDWALAHTIREGETIRDELIEIDAFDGNKKIILNYTSPVFDENGQMLGAIVVNNDITKLKQTEYEIIKLKDELEIKVEEKTRELKERVAELERFHEATIDRELRMKELRDEIERLKNDKL